MHRIRTYIIALVFVLSLVTVLAMRNQLGEPDDAFCERVLNKGKCAEARSWALEAEGTTQLRTIYEFDNPRSREIIQQLYDLGAERVTACDIDVEAGVGETTNVLVVTLPSDSEARKKLLNSERSHARRLGFDG